MQEGFAKTLSDHLSSNHEDTAKAKHYQGAMRNILLVTEKCWRLPTSLFRRDRNARLTTYDLQHPTVGPVEFDLDRM